MTDEIITPPADGQPEPPAETPPVDGQGQSAEEIKAELERTRKALKDANKEAADRRKKLDAFEAAEKERQAAAMTELEKAQAEAAEAKKLATEAEEARTQAEAKALERLMKASVISAATAAGFNDPADAWLYIDRSKIALKDDESFDGIDKALEEVAKAKPYLLKPAQGARIGTPRAGQRPANGAGKEPAPVKVRL